MLANKRILVVDDQPDDLESIKKIYKNTGIRINQAGSEFGVFNTIEQYGKCADAIILDLSLKGSDTLELAEKLRQNDRYKDIPIVVIGEQISIDMVKRVKDLQIQHLIKKPFSAEYLKKTVDTLLDSDTLK